jgi:asparagine synthase (glutamine-hydrolysing)
MSGFVLVYHRDGEPVDRTRVAGMMATLKHRGPDGYRVSCHQQVALGHHHFWTTPEEVGERQPLWSDDGRVGLVFDGRLDNRDELVHALRLDDPDARHASDATIMLHAYEHWAEEALSHLLGPFAVAIYDKPRKRVVCARDPLGDQSLYYYLDERLLLVASEEQALLAHPVVSGELDETTLAYYFAVRAPYDGRTFFKDVRELLPAHTLCVTTDTAQAHRYWTVNPEARLAYRSDAEYGEHFRELLDRSVWRCLRASGSPAVMMSGGLDSTSVAALAARQQADSNKPEDLRTFSWTFEQFPICDERSYMDPLIQRYHLRAIRVNGDGDWPLSKDIPVEAFNPSYPYLNPYYLLKLHLYRAARDNNVRVLLTGAAGDELYSGAEDWLLDLLLERRFVEAGRELLQASRMFGVTRVLGSRSLKRIGSRLLDRIPGGRSLLAMRRACSINQIPWLTASARCHLPDLNYWQNCTQQKDRSRQTRNIIAPYGALGSVIEYSYASRMQIELRHPYRDRQLVEFMLAVPAHQLYKQQQLKFILRTAMAELLPAKILNRLGPTSLLPFYRYGFKQRRNSLMRTLLEDPQAIWRRFVHPEWLETIVWQQLENQIDGGAALLPWRTLSLERWMRMMRKTDNEPYTTS